MVTRTQEEALAMIEGEPHHRCARQGHPLMRLEFRRKIKSGEAEFGAIAQAESHCSSAKREGDLGFFGRNQMQSAFDT